MKDERYQKVRNYGHYTGEYRDVANSVWNLKYSVPNKITIVFITDQTMIIILS